MIEREAQSDTDREKYSVIQRVSYDKKLKDRRTCVSWYREKFTERQREREAQRTKDRKVEKYTERNGH